MTVCPFAAAGLLAVAAPAAPNIPIRPRLRAAAGDGPARVHGRRLARPGLEPDAGGAGAYPDRAGRHLLDGTIRVFEGRGYEATADRLQRARRPAYSPDSSGYTLTSWALGHSVTVPLMSPRRASSGRRRRAGRGDPLHRHHPATAGTRSANDRSGPAAAAGRRADLRRVRQRLARRGCRCASSAGNLYGPRRRLR